MSWGEYPGGRSVDHVLCAMLTPSKVERALVAAGLLVECPKFGPALPGKPLCGAVGISAAGLRRLADEMDAGRVPTAPEWFARQARERRTGGAV